MNIWSKELLMATGGKIYTFVQPILTGAAPIGGSSFGVEASAEKSSQYAWKVFDNNSSSTYWTPAQAITTTETLTFYNPNPLNVTQIITTFTSTSYDTSLISIEGSNNNTNWTTITKSDTGTSTLTSALTNNNYYKYYKMAFKAPSSGIYRVRNIEITATVKGG